jgi:hypothetical protein
VRFGCSMRGIVLLLTGLAATGCRESVAAIDGGLRDPDAATVVWVDGSEERAFIEGALFRLGEVRGDTVELRFASNSDEVGTMRLLGLGSGARLTLHGIWFDDGVAFPSSIDLAGTRIVNINGIRMAGPDQVSGWVETSGEVLAREGSNALILRPLDDGLPDLRVVVPREATVRGEDGEPGSLDRVGFGDRLTVRGTAEAGYVHASEIIVPRRVGSGESQTEDQRRTSEGASQAPITTPSRSASPPPAPPPAAQPARGREADREPPARGRDRPNPGRGRGQGRDNER